MPLSKTTFSVSNRRELGSGFLTQRSTECGWRYIINVILSGNFRGREDNTLFNCGRGHIEVIKLLLEKGADIEAADSNGRTLLYRASLNGHDKVVKLLLEKGADMNTKDSDGWTPLYGPLGTSTLRSSSCYSRRALI